MKVIVCSSVYFLKTYNMIETSSHDDYMGLVETVVQSIVWQMCWYFEQGR